VHNLIDRGVVVLLTPLLFFAATARCERFASHAEIHGTL
jgi:hypothetical protein